jgi:hypothetical protein
MKIAVERENKRQLKEQRFESKDQFLDHLSKKEVVDKHLNRALNGENVLRV